MVSKARLDLPLPLGPVTTVSLPSGRSTLMPLRLFLRAPRISMQSFDADAAARPFLAIFKPTGDDSRLQRASQILYPLRCPKRRAQGAVSFPRVASFKGRRLSHR